MKALGLLRERYSFPRLRIHLHKAIPLGAGLGGGSADAACILKAVARHYSLNATEGELREIALEAGSDCPFFIANVPSYATGRGEILKPVDPVPGSYHIVLLNPGVHSATGEAYSNVKPAMPPETLDKLITLPVREWKNRIVNDFEEYAFRKFPIIELLKETLYKAGAVFSLMSGSGSTVYGIFSEKPVLQDDARKYLIYEGVM
jgi:4-diphosphocytidyl-2-C-methyl-D-erythritol kinase